MRIGALAFCLLALLLPSRGEAQTLQSQVFVSGFNNPVAFIPSPTDTATYFVIEQSGLIRVVHNGALQSTPFLDLRGSLLAGGERGLLGLAFAPDYASSRRFFVNFTNTSGHTVIARFLRSASDSHIADPASRFDLRWSTGQRLIEQPFSNHNGGTIAFGPDGYLYIGMGDGGSGNDPNHLAQTPSSLLGKMLRIDVSVPDSDPEGFNVPASNPFVGVSGYAPEIWSVGLRNPWKWSFDNPAHGGTGALLIADVGQNTWEEINYEPPATGGLNYGWRNREGAHDNVTSLPPAFTPLTDPIFEYDHSTGGSITGGFVYRGQLLGSAMRGRYFFADFSSGRVWSIALTPASGGQVTASDLREHTAELGGSSTLGLISAFGEDTAGELYILNWSGGRVLRIVSTAAAASPFLQIDIPAAAARVRQPFAVSGWAIDRNATGNDPGIDAVHVWAYPADGSAPLFCGSHYGGARADIGAFFGARFTNSGFGIVVRGLAPGAYRLVAFGRATSTGTFDAVRVVDVIVEVSGLIGIDAPAASSLVSRSLLIGGWAADPAATTGSGFDVLQVWAYPAAGGAPVFLGTPAYGGNRPDIAAFLGDTFAPSAFNLGATLPSSGVWDIVVFARSTITGRFDSAQVVRVTAQ